MSSRCSIQTVDARAHFYIRHTGQRAVSRARANEALS
jgi:hypothetical protein